MCKYYPLSGLCHMCSLCGEGYGNRAHQMIITTQLARHPCWATFYLWAPPWCDETCNVQGSHWVVPIPCICHCLIHTLWNIVCKVEGTGHMISRHWEGPRRGSVRADSFDEANTDVPLKVSVLHLVLPVKWDQCWLVDGHCCGVGVNMKL